MARFHNYSFENIPSIAHHRPDATHVAGIRTWNELGRYVKKGQKGIPILAPMIGAKRQRDEEPAEPSNKPAPVLIGFRVVYVLDIGQTEGAELPEPATVTGEVGTRHDRLQHAALCRNQGGRLHFAGVLPAQGGRFYRLQKGDLGDTPPFQSFVPPNIPHFLSACRRTPTNCFERTIRTNCLLINDLNRSREFGKMLGSVRVAAPQGFEPRYAAPEAAVLPLNEGATSAKLSLCLLPQWPDPRQGAGHQKPT